MKYVVACDPERGGRELLTAMQRLSGDDGAVTIIHVVNPLGEPWRDRERDLPDATTVVVDRQRRLIEDLAHEVGLTAEVTVEASRAGEETATAVARIAEALGAETLVVMSKRASGIRGMLLGSVAQGLLTLSPCPVLVVRPSD